MLSSCLTASRAVGRPGAASVLGGLGPGPWTHWVLLGTSPADYCEKLHQQQYCWPLVCARPALRCRVMPRKNACTSVNA